MAEQQLLLTPRLQQRAEQLIEQTQQQRCWNGDLPVLLLERCWLRLQVVSVGELARRLPPDSTAEAPELVRFRELRRGGAGNLEAQELIWQEFGRERCAEALRRYWSAQDRGNHGWTLSRYLQLIDRYREGVESSGATPIPLLLLARSGSSDSHELHWCWPESRPMGHTCP
jgi:hypothetical protein